MALEKADRHLMDGLKVLRRKERNARLAVMAGHDGHARAILDEIRRLAFELVTYR